MDLAPGVEKIRIHGRWAVLEESSRGYFTIRCKGFPTLDVDMDENPEKKAALVEDAAGWRVEMQRMRLRLIAKAKKVWK